MLERLAPRGGVQSTTSPSAPLTDGCGIGGLLLDDALALFLREGARIAYQGRKKMTRDSSTCSVRVGSVEVERRELRYQEGRAGCVGTPQQDDVWFREKSSSVGAWEATARPPSTDESRGHITRRR